MTSVLATAFAFTLAVQGGAGWVWSLYDRDGGVALAREVPDSSQLSAVFECVPGSGTARLTVYGPVARPDFVNLSAGEVSADAETAPGTDLAVRLQLDHPVLLALERGETLTVSAGTEVISLPPPAAALLMRFRSVCN